MIRISNLKVNPPFTQEKLKAEVAKTLSVSIDRLSAFRIVKSSIDARKENHVFYLCSVEVSLPNEENYTSLKDVIAVTDNEPYEIAITPEARLPLVPEHKHPPVLVGSGPAGLMAALVLARAGLKPILLERGKPADERKKDVDRFRATGILDVESNVQFGEGGAGTFSDGKLTTGTRDPRIRFVLETFIKHGAPDDILYSAKPHIGTDLLIEIVQSIRREIVSLGGEFRFGHKLSALNISDNTIKSILVTTSESTYELPVDRLILAIGHSARDTLDMLYKAGVRMEQKAFSAGVRIEHKQAQINRVQYGSFADVLPSADYKLSIHLSPDLSGDSRGVYTFCMCPGGEVIAAASEEGCLVTNGMSYFKRNLTNANSALLVSVKPEDFPSEHPLAGIEFQRTLERAAYKAGGGNYKAPAQRVDDFLHHRATKAFGAVQPSYHPGVIGYDLAELLPDFISKSIRMALPFLDRKLKGFADPDAVMTGFETRSSSPVRIVRDENNHASIRGIIPCGEGCGYAGGIMSAAVDGIRCAESIYI